MKSVFRAIGCGCVFLSASLAQEGSHFTFDVGAGFSAPVGTTGQNLDDGWVIQGGVGYNFLPWLGAKVDVGYNSFGVNSSMLANLGVNSGSMQVFSATVDPIVHLTPNRRFDLYVTGGGGLFRESQSFGTPTNTVVTGYNPFFGLNSSVLGTAGLGSYSVNRPGIDVGAGVALGTKFHGKIFAEAKYDRILLPDRHIDYLPVTFGFRW